MTGKPCSGRKIKSSHLNLRPLPLYMAQGGPESSESGIGPQPPTKRTRQTLPRKKCPGRTGAVAPGPGLWGGGGDRRWALEEKHGLHPFFSFRMRSRLETKRGRSPVEAGNSLAEKGVPSRVGITFLLASPMLHVNPEGQSHLRRGWGRAGERADFNYR